MVKLDYYQNPILSTEDAVNCLLRGKEIDGAFLDETSEIELFNRAISRLTEFHDEVLQRPEEELDFVEYHRNLSQIWSIPTKYNEIDLEIYLLEKVSTEEEYHRVVHELEMYRDRNLEGLVRCMIYLVDCFRKNNILWGIGRGSSVSSYILYLIGINRINPMKYNLSIEEFLK